MNLKILILLSIVVVSCLGSESFSEIEEDVIREAYVKLLQDITDTMESNTPTVQEAYAKLLQDTANTMREIADLGKEPKPTRHTWVGVIFSLVFGIIGTYIAEKLGQREQLAAAMRLFQRRERAAARQPFAMTHPLYGLNRRCAVRVRSGG